MIKKRTAILGAVVIILMTAFISSFLSVQISRYVDVEKGDRVIITRDQYKLLSKMEDTFSVQKLNELEDYYKTFEQVRTKVEDNYYEDIDNSVLFEGAIDGMVEAVGDKYTYYFDPQEYKEFTERLNNSYAGIGTLVSIDEDNRIVILRVFEDTPAEESGLLAGDVISKISGNVVNGDNYEDAVEMMRGTPDTDVNITILRNEEEIEVKITRAVIQLPDLDYEMLDNKIGYINLYKFDTFSSRNFKNAVEDLNSQGMKGLVLDLRGNPGGLLSECVAICDILLPEGVIVSRRNRKGVIDENHSDAEYLNIPFAVLVDGQSASASEVLSGAVQDYGVGTIIGETTFGKGIVQTILTDFEDGSALKITTEKYFTPNGRDIHKKGINPDITEQLSQEAIDYIVNNPGEELPVELDNVIQAGITNVIEKLEEKK